MKRWKWLPPGEIAADIKDEAAPMLAIGVMVDYDKEIVNIVYADLTWKRVPFSRFKPSGTFGSSYYCEPDFTDFDISDWGLSIRFGNYEANADAI